MTTGSPWRQDATTPGVVYGNPPAPSGAATQVIPIGAPPSSAGDPDLLPRNTVSSPVDISALFGLVAGEVMAFTTPMGSGTFAGRAKLVKSVLWTWDVRGNIPTIPLQYVVQLVTIPAGVEPFSAIVANQIFVNDDGLSYDRAVVKGGYEPAVYIPPGFQAIVYVLNAVPASDPTAGTRQRLYMQWQLV